MNAKLDATFHALADPTRRAMLVRLGRGERTIAELAAPFDMSLWGATKHIRVLEDAGLVSCRKEGRARFCSLRPGPLAQANRWLNQWEKFWMNRLDRLETLIEREKGAQPMNEFQRPAPDTLRIERLLDAPIDTVWRWLVDPALRRQWFAGGTAIEGEGDLVLEFDHDELSPAPYPPEFAKYKGVRSNERVLRCEPPRLLSFTWDGGKEGIATFELSPEGNKTRLVLLHSGISGPAPAANFGGGWLSHIAALQIRVAGGEVKDFWRLYYDAKAVVEAELKRGSP